jgi:tRNA A58 N-methylase Trm61
MYLKSEKLGHKGLLHTFEHSEEKVKKAKEIFREWKQSYDISAETALEKWPQNVRFGHMDFCDHEFNEKYTEFYNSIYLDMANTDKALVNAYKILKKDGVLVINALHLTQIIKCLNKIKEENLHFENELVIEPNNRFWELRKIHQQQQQQKDSSTLDDSLKWTCRLEDRFVEKFKRGGAWFNYWSGFLIKLRKIK